MMYESASFVGIIVAAVANMALGFVWYGPLFGKPWMRAMGITKEQMAQMKGSDLFRLYGFTFLASLVEIYVLGILVRGFGISTVAGGAYLGILTGVGFIATVKFTEVLFEKKSKETFLIGAGYQIVGAALIGALLAIVG